MNNLWKAEFYKVWHSKSFWGILLLSVVLGMVMMLDHKSPATAIECFHTSLVLSLYLGYGMMLGLPVHFLPRYQIRDVMIHPEVMVAQEALIVTFVWFSALFFAAWKIFRRCDLR